MRILIRCQPLLQKEKTNARLPTNKKPPGLASGSSTEIDFTW
jgi:hypothetical protein